MIDIKRNICFLAFAVLTLLWMAVIFGFSADNAEDSTVQSNTVTETFLRLFNPGFDELGEAQKAEMISKYDGLVRKLAHFAAYAVLGFLMYFTVLSAPFLTYINNGNVLAIISILLCVIFAISDEIHQTFVDGRAGRLTDVLIDSAGVLCGTAAASAMLLVCRKLKRK